MPARKVPLVDHHALGLDGDPTREENLQRSLPLASCRDFAWTLNRISSLDAMNRTSRIRLLVTVSALLLLVLESSAAAGPPTHSISSLRKTRVQAVVKAPGFPDWMARGFGYMWIANGSSIERVDPTTNKRAGIAATDTEPCEGLATGFGSVWTVDCQTSALLRVDPQSGRVVTRIALPGLAPDGEGLIAVGGDGVWVPTSDVGAGTSLLVRVDPRNNAIVASIPVPYDSSGAAAGFGSIWLTSARTASVLRINPADNSISARIKVHRGPRFIATGQGGVWSLNQRDGSVSRINPSTNRVVATVRLHVPGSGGCIAAGVRGVWVTMPGTPLSQIQPARNKILGQWVGVGGDCVTTGFSSVWLANHDLHNVWRIKPH